MEKACFFATKFWEKYTTMVMRIAMIAMAEAKPLFWDTSPTNSL